MAIPIRIEELLPMASWLSSLVENNLAKFNDFSPEFSDSYLTTLDDKKEKVRELLSPQLFIGEMVKATQRLRDNMLAARPPLLKLEGYVVRAKDELSVAVKIFGFSGVRKNIKGGDAEGFGKKLADLLYLADTNSSILEAKGLKTETIALLEDILLTNTQLAQAQNDAILAKEKAVTDNDAVMNDLWKDCKNIMDAGKRIYKYNDPEMVKNFTKVHIIKTMRHDTARKKKDVSV